MQQGSQEWLKLRKSKIGASDAPIIMGVSPWRTPYQLWEEKLGMNAGQKENAAMRYGKAMEEVARQAYQEVVGVEVSPEVVFHKEVDYMMASLDGLSSDRQTAVEIKNANADDHAIAKSGSVPEKYYPQLQHQLACLCINQIHYFSYHNGEGVLVVVDKDDSYLEKLYAEEKKFWECVLSLQAPELHNKNYNTTEDAEFIRVASEWKNVTEQIKRLESLEKSYKEQLIERANGSDVRGGGIRVEKSSRKGAVNYKMIPELIGVDLEQYRKSPTECWRISCVEG